MALDWTAGMAQAFELVALDPATWTETGEVGGLVSCDITWEDEGLRCSATIEMDNQPSAGYYRVYLIATQGSESERVALATVLAETDSWSSDGKRITYKLTGYSPLRELDDDMPSLGWTPGAADVASVTASIFAEHCRAPFTAVACDTTASTWVAEEDDTWLDVVESLLSAANMHLEVNEYGAITAVPDDTDVQITPSYTFDDDNSSSILMPDMSVSLSRFDTPNRAEAIWSGDSGVLVSYAENNDADSVTSIPSRGRVVLVRDTAPDVSDTPSQAELDAYAVEMLRDASSQTRKHTYTHGYVPDVVLGSHVRLANSAIGYEADAVVVKQVVSCTPGCKVEETAEWDEGTYIEIENVDS